MYEIRSPHLLLPRRFVRLLEAAVGVAHHEAGIAEALRCDRVPDLLKNF